MTYTSDIVQFLILLNNPQIIAASKKEKNFNLFTYTDGYILSYIPSGISYFDWCEK